MKLFIKVCYIGTAYCGYQVQPNAISIQQRLNEAALAVFGYACDIVGCSRTDSGVHANAFSATIAKKGSEELCTAVPLERIPLALSAHLPEDICVYDAKWVSNEFHARYDVIEKEYLYRIWNSPIRNPFENGRSARVPRPIDEKAFKQMQIAAQHFCGTHDFSAYMAQGSKVTSTVRTVTGSVLEREGNLILYRVAADGFLYNMVRILTGTLMEVAEGRIAPEEIPAITASHDRARAGSTMPACGLYLNRVTYRDSLV